MKAKRKLLISMLAIVFVLLAVVATIAIAFALTQQNITTSVNIEINNLRLLFILFSPFPQFQI